MHERLVAALAASIDTERALERVLVQGRPQTLDIRILGPLRAFRGDQELDLGSPPQRAMLAMLLLYEGRVATFEELSAAIWDEEAPSRARARATLHTYVTRLRALLEPDRSNFELLTSGGQGYVLRLPADVLDLTRFDRGIAEAEAARKAGRLREAAESLRASLTLFEGEPLTGIVGPYAERQRAHLAERRLSAIETLMDLELDLGNHAGIVAELIALTADHPLHEGLCAQLMLALYRCGRHSDALNTFTQMRKALIDNLGIEPRPELSTLYQRILAADPTLNSVPARQPQGPKLPGPAQLPADINDFTGRWEVAARLRTLLSAQPVAEGMPLVAISGLAGVGKTALAVHVAHQATEAFPDGQLYADLRAYTDEATRPEFALGGFLRALGMPPDLIPDGLTERSALYRSILAERRILVLLDNAHDADQVSPLLPGSPGCATIVTSRIKLADLPGAHLVELGVMEPDEALSLLSAVAGRERVAAEHSAATDVVTACRFLPLAVRLLAARLAARPSWTVATLAARLAHAQRRPDLLRVGNLSFESPFALAYSQLTPEQARVFRLLSLPNGPDISADAAAALLDLSVSKAEELLESLLDASLLEISGPGRYRLRDTLRPLTRRELDKSERPEDRAAALRRLLGFYLASAQAAHRLAYENSMIADDLVASGVGGTFPSADEAVTWLIVESDLLFATIDQAVASARMGEQLLPVGDLLVAMEPLLDSGAHTREFDRGARAVLAAALTLGDRGSELRSRYVLGRVLFDADKPREAEEQLRRAHELSVEYGEKAITGQVLTALAVVVGRQRRHADALALFDAAMNWYRENGVLTGEALSLSYSARDHLGMGEIEGAIAAAEKGVAMFTEAGSDGGTARARYHLGVVLSRTGRLAGSVYHHLEALAFFRATNQHVWEQRVCLRLAETFITAKRYPEAVHHAEQALIISRDISYPYGEAMSLTVLGNALRELGSTSRSLDCLQQAFDIFSRLSAPEADPLRAILDRTHSVKAGSSDRPISRPE
ncbi:SARP family transcriptional regulator [Spongiactinospora rosea]|uniref:SARP family transcriptional regulator n=2 Tax=Spongiactinospora rosea TaxID=2248750 RepID=A0A366LEB1_9ACTN|nr:SARP family transcriptional regulator [Spongiactinospora rosea]